MNITSLKRAPCYVYVILMIGTRFVKVGISAEPDAGLSKLQEGNPFELRLLICERIDGRNFFEYSAPDLQKRIQDMFFSERIGSEWFDLDVENLTGVLDTVKASTAESTLEQAQKAQAFAKKRATIMLAEADELEAEMTAFKKETEELVKQGEL